MSVPVDGGSSVVVHGAMRAYKAAFLVTDERGGISFRGAGFGGRYGPVDSAQCFHDAQHVPPHPGCSCGFYGWRHRIDAVALLSDRLVSVLEVDLWGAFHEFERGYIAAAQRVRSVTLWPWCSKCPLGQEELTDLAVGLIERRLGDGELVPVCDDHAGDAGGLVTVEALRTALGVPLGWADGEDPVAKFWPFGRLSPPVLLHRQLPGLDDLLPWEVAYVFPDAIAQDEDGGLWIDPTARLIQPLLGTDIPVRLGDDGRHEILLDGVRLAPWRPRRDNAARFALPLRAIGGNNVLRRPGVGDE